MAQNPKSVNLQTNGDVENIKGTPKQRTILIVVIVLLILSIVLLSIRLADYAQASEREVSLQNNSDSQIHLFSMHYENENGEVIIQSDQGDKVVAPGVGSTYTIRLRNTDEYALDYLIDPHIAVVGSKETFPMLVRMSDSDGNYVLGSAEEWATVKDLRQFSHKGTLLKAEAEEFIFEWMWPYESGNDELDTLLGNEEKDIGLEVSFQFHSVANLAFENNEGFDNPNIVKIVALSVASAILLGAAIVLIVLAVQKQKQALLEGGDGELLPGSRKPEREERRKDPSNEPLSVSLEMLASNFSAGAVINLVNLKRRGLVPITTKRIHIVASPNFHLSKPFMVFANSVSADARRIIMAAGGTVFGARK